MFKQDKTRAQEALAKEAQRGSGFGPRMNLWAPDDGDNLIRIMPPWTDQGPNRFVCWRQVGMHFGIGASGSERAFVCTTKTPDLGGACPVCQYVEQLRATKEPGDAERASDLRAKERYYSSVVDMKDAIYTAKDLKEWSDSEFNKGKDCPFAPGDTKVQIWSYGPTVYGPLLSLLSDASVDISSLDEGYNIILTKSGKGKYGTEYRVRPEFKSTVLQFKSSQAKDKWLPNLDTLGLLQPATLEDMREAVEGARLGSAPVAPLGSHQAAPSLPAAHAAPQPSVPAPQPRPAVPLPAEKPSCFADKTFHSDTDAECVGGRKADETTGRLQTYDPCPFFGDCKKAIFGEPEAPPPRRGRRPAAPTEDGVSALEAQMRSHLTGGK